MLLSTQKAAYFRKNHRISKRFLEIYQDVLLTKSETWVYITTACSAHQHTTIQVAQTRILMASVRRTKISENQVDNVKNIGKTNPELLLYRVPQHVKN